MSVTNLLQISDEKQVCRLSVATAMTRSTMTFFLSSPPPLDVPRRRWTFPAATVAVVVHRYRRPRLAGSVLPQQRTPTTPRVAHCSRLLSGAAAASWSSPPAPVFACRDRPPFPPPRVPSDSAAAHTFPPPLAITRAPTPRTPPSPVTERSRPHSDDQQPSQSAHPDDQQLGHWTDPHMSLPEDQHHLLDDHDEFMSQLTPPPRPPPRQ
ncbi:hypothetical protein Scep_009263 [Stephania cephalantha]|uniref:Uncharacterized protein n=1 Tax=Stephania cephalantha TaxID=152367 RepID=A0AAP0PCZ7_9MAGN